MSNAGGSALVLTQGVPVNPIARKRQVWGSNIAYSSRKRFLFHSHRQCKCLFNKIKKGNGIIITDRVAFPNFLKRASHNSIQYIQHGWQPSLPLPLHVSESRTMETLQLKGVIVWRQLPASPPMMRTRLCPLWMSTNERRRSPIEACQE